MISQTPWIERKFEFNFPVGVFPCILERVRGTPGRMEEMLRGVPVTVLTKRVDNKWSIQEHCGHLCDLDDLHDGRIQDYLSGATVLRPADMTNRKTSEADHNARPIADLLHQFRQARSAMVRRFESLSESQAVLVAEHPRLRTPMRLVDMAYFVAEHDDHHLARMTELLRTIPLAR